MFEGIKVQIGNDELVIPPLNFKALRTLADKIERITSYAQSGGAAIPAEQLDAMTDVILSAINRNYPEYTREQLEDILDMGNIANITAAVMGQAGYKKGKEQAPTEGLSL